MASALTDRELLLRALDELAALRAEVEATRELVSRKVRRKPLPTPPPEEPAGAIGTGVYAKIERGRRR